MDIPQQHFATYLEKLRALQQITNFNEYEKRFSEIHTEFGREMLEHQISKQPSATEKKVYKKKFKPNLEKQLLKQHTNLVKVAMGLSKAHCCRN